MSKKPGASTGDQAKRAIERQRRDEELRLAVMDQHRFARATELRTQELSRQWWAKHPPPWPSSASNASPRLPLENGSSVELFEGPVPLDAEVAAYQFSGWPWDFQRISIRSVLRDWPARQLRALARFANQLADEKERA